MSESGTSWESGALAESVGGLRLSLKPPYAPMEAKRAEALPEGDSWMFEPKWDGFRALAFRDGDTVILQSKAGQPLGRYFPEVVEAVRRLPFDRFVLDGEIVIDVDGRLSFDDLLLRIHPAASRVQKLSQLTPASYLVFDILAQGADTLVDEPLALRREKLETFFVSARVPSIRKSPYTTERKLAQDWFENYGSHGLDGIMAKKTGAAYASGKRDAMMKVKRLHTADCVVGGFRYQKTGGVLGALLLGLFNADGRLDHVGMSSAFKAVDRKAILRMLEPLAGRGGFTGKSPGGPSRWSGGKVNEFGPVEPILVCEVRYDYFNQGRFRHGTKFLRWRPDKAPRQCTYQQVQT